MKNIENFLRKYTNAPEIVHIMLEYAKTSPEHPIYHPEGTLDKHIDIVVGRCMEKNNTNLHFAGLFHDITKHGYCQPLWGDKKVGKLKTINEGSYWQNVYHAEQAVKFIDLDDISAWVIRHGGDLEKIKRIVGNHMRMKTYLRGEKGIKGGMKKTKRDAMKARLSDVWEDLYYFSNYCDNMLYEK